MNIITTLPRGHEDNFRQTLVGSPETALCIGVQREMDQRWSKGTNWPNLEQNYTILSWINLDKVLQSLGTQQKPQVARVWLRMGYTPLNPLIRCSIVILGYDMICHIFRHIPSSSHSIHDGEITIRSRRNFHTIISFTIKSPLKFHIPIPIQSG